MPLDHAPALRQTIDARTYADPDALLTELKAHVDAKGRFAYNIDPQSRYAALPPALAAAGSVTTAFRV